MTWAVRASERERRPTRAGSLCPAHGRPARQPRTGLHFCFLGGHCVQADVERRVPHGARRMQVLLVGHHHVGKDLVQVPGGAARDSRRTEPWRWRSRCICAKEHSPLERPAIEALAQLKAAGNITRAKAAVVGPELVVNLLVVVEPHLGDTVEVSDGGGCCEGGRWGEGISRKQQSNRSANDNRNRAREAGRKGRAAARRQMPLSQPTG